MSTKKSQTQKRVKFLDEILSVLQSHEIFSDLVSRERDTEHQIRKALFLRLQNKLPQLLEKYFGYSEKKSSHVITNDFKWEQKRNTTVSNFLLFSTAHRPDAVLEVENLRIAIEVKKGVSGSSIRSGLGQAVVYSTQFDFVLYFFVDISDGHDILSSVSAQKEAWLIKKLWSDFNIRWMVV